MGIMKSLEGTLIPCPLGKIIVMVPTQPWALGPINHASHDVSLVKQALNLIRRSLVTPITLVALIFFLTYALRIERVLNN
jgi:hypothetical protein